MKIKEVVYWRENLSLSRPYEIAFKKVAVVENIIVLIRLENGIFGIGSGNPSWEVTGESIDDTEHCIKSFVESEILNGKDIKCFQSLTQVVRLICFYNPAAMAALDIALHDCFGKFLQIAVVDLYGRQRHSIPTSITIGIKNVEETLQEAEEYVNGGFKILKVKLGHELKLDIERLKKIREIHKKNIKIRVDANQGYSTTEARNFLKLTEDLNLELIEQPVAPKQFPFSVEKKFRKKIAADESILGLSDAVKLVTGTNRCEIFNIKLMKCGGISSAMSIVAVANIRNIKLMWGCNDESIISITAALHIAYANVNTRYIDLDGSFDLAKDVVKGGFKLVDGCLQLVKGYGLGVDLI